jgi:hypothetical protein
MIVHSGGILRTMYLLGIRGDLPHDVLMALGRIERSPDALKVVGRIEISRDALIEVGGEDGLGLAWG